MVLICCLDPATDYQVKSMDGLTVFRSTAAVVATHCPRDRLWDNMIPVIPVNPGFTVKL